MKPIGYFSDLVDSRIQEGNYEVNGAEPGSVEIKDNDGETIEMRHVSAFLPFSVAGTVISSSYGVEQVAGLILAASHFNNRVSSIVPDLERLDDCNIKFTMEMFDTMYSPFRASRDLITQVFPRMKSNDILERRKWPTALNGPMLNPITTSLASVASAFKLTQVTHVSPTTPLHLRKELYPYVGRVRTSFPDFNAANLEYFATQLDSSHVYWINSWEETGDNTFFRRALELNIKLEQEFFPRLTMDLEKTVEEVLDRLEASQVRHIHCMLIDKEWSAMIPRVVERGLFGPEYVWMIGGTIFDGWEFTPDDPFTKFLNNTLSPVFNHAPDLPGYDTFNSEWLREYENFRPEMERLLPAHVTSLPTWEDYQLPFNSEKTLGLYDAFMSIGLAACEQQRMNRTASEFYSTWLESDFQGATGRIRFDEFGSLERGASEMKMMINVLGSVDEGVVTIRSLPLSGYKKTDAAGEPLWITSDNAWLVGTPPPALPAAIVEKEGIEAWSPVIGYVVFAVITICAIASSAWVYRFRYHEVVISAQPLFLYLICLGTVLMATAIVTLSVVDSSPNPDAACMATPWLLSVGFTIAFAAFFTKLKRINTIFHASKSFKKVVITPVQVLKPFVCLLCMNVLVLILWTVVSPFQYTGVPTNYDKFGRAVTVELKCKSDLFLEFGSALAFVNSIAFILTIYHAYKARKLIGEFREGESIYIALLIALQSFLIGGPAVAAADAVGNATQEYLTRLCVVLWGCLGLLLPLFISLVLRKGRWATEQEEKAERRAQRMRRSTEFALRTRDPMMGYGYPKPRFHTAHTMDDSSRSSVPHRMDDFSGTSNTRRRSLGESSGHSAPRQRQLETETKIERITE